MDRKPSVFTSVEELATSSRKEELSQNGIQRTAEIRSLHSGVGFELTSYYDRHRWHETAMQNFQFTLGKFEESAGSFSANIKMTPDLKRGENFSYSPANSSDLSSGSSASGGKGRKRRKSEESHDQDSPNSNSVAGDSSGQIDSPNTTEETDEGQHCRKKAKISFSTEQVDALESCYQEHKYLPANIRRRLASTLKLTDTQVKTWFQNRRMKQKRQRKMEENTRAFFLPTGGVDIAQLKAMGIPCPPPHTTQNVKFPARSDFSSPMTVKGFGTPQGTSTPNRFQGYVPSPMGAAKEGFRWSKDSSFSLVSPSAQQSKGSLNSSLATGHVPMTSYLVDATY